MTDIHVVLVNENDEAIGTMEKMEAHLKPNLHRAFSVFLFDQKGRMLLQKRALSKYHSGGLWTNTCCSHPYPDEDVTAAAYRRLNEEMGIKTAVLNKAFDFIYQAEFENGLFEYEFDHVFVGEYEGVILPDENEVAETGYRSIGAIREELATNPESYTPWFKIALPLLEEYLAG